MGEVVNLVENPNILLCKFDKKFLSIPREILILTFIIVGIIYFKILRTMKLSETKKIHYRKFFLYFRAH